MRSAFELRVDDKMNKAPDRPLPIEDSGKARRRIECGGRDAQLADWIPPTDARFQDSAIAAW